MIQFQFEKNLKLDEFIEVLEKSGLATRRPMDHPSQLKQMLENSNLVITARVEGELVGILRGLTDYCYRSFISDLAVKASFQQQGIGRLLLEKARNAAPEARLFLFSAEDAEGFYQKLGFQLHERCYQLKPKEMLL